MRNFATHSAQLQVNADEAHTKELYGREHVVAPVTLVREMVLKGELLPFEEIRRTAMAWNSAPVTVTHPRTDEGGFLPASTNADEFAAHAVGHIFNVETNAERRALEGEVWLDAERAASTAASLERDDPAGMLLDGDSVEVSTGYWYRKNDSSGSYEGADYTAEQQDVQPDHLATLPNGVGECSIEDGCGAGTGETAAAAAQDSGFESSGQEMPVAFSANCPQHGSLDDATLRQRLVAALGLNSDGGCECEHDGALNVDVGDAVRWASDGAGSVETSDGTYRYGVVVDGLQDDNEPDDSLLVAVYEPADGEWENRNEQNAIREDRLEVVGDGGKASLPAISSLGGQSADGDGADASAARMVLATNNGDSYTMTTFDMEELATQSGLSMEALQSLDDDEVEALAETTLADDGDGDSSGDEETDPQGGGDGDGDSSGDGETANDAALTAENIREIVREEVTEAQHSDEKQQLIAQIQSHSDAVDEDDLAGMSVEALEGLARDVKPTGGIYAGRAGATSGGSDTVEMGASMDDLAGSGGDD